MKELIITFLFALLLSCLLNGIGQEYSTEPLPVSIKGVAESSFGLRRDAGDIGEINFVDKPRDNKFMTTIDEKSEERNVDFPLGANN